MSYTRAHYLFIVVLIYISCAPTLLSAGSAIPSHTYTESIPPDEWPFLDDDLEFQYLDIIANQPSKLSAVKQSLHLGDQHFTAAQLQRSLKHFLALANAARNCSAKGPRNPCLANFNQSLKKDFLLFKLQQSAQLTAYYTPTIDVNPIQTQEYRYPIYSPPPTKLLRTASREEIDFQHRLDHQGLELYYARDRYDVYLLHMEGGGRLRVHKPQGISFQYISYAGDNGKPFRLIYEYMLKHGMLRAGHYSQLDQRNYLQQHPDAEAEIYASSPGYVFFNKTRHSPTGSAGVPLTANRSLAVDPDYYPLHGLIAFINATISTLPADSTVPLNSNPPGLIQQKMQRFFIAQDEGTYIKGPNRFDLYFGEDNYAYFLANNFHSKGQIYFLVLKE